MKLKFSGASTARLNNSELLISKDTMDSGKMETIGDVLKHLCNTDTDVRSSFFDRHGELAHGTICIINKMDWEIVQREKTPVMYGDEMVLISTIHGG
ncbi:ubiquitin-related modifier-like protein [Ordospora colligata]|uniref:Ubiquitin-related modifier 1 n=1 Tax=Ordospora colligata OC4 TaxID=1354746 RepID=A0A0B2UL61_9MICR|nr:ubiquitin-related modifier-like protein [Ordospora colligata OC4]KHN70108.1 ubiquitin-related modifier-like protein [Ordospora colligata OC4]TBU16490.1 ubiquitin-related modifier-like protein [Ordospora colligata]TBU16675.1 ubiquitin-related modifier-like protein [Ordospora colligata]TBU19248.1 ubiquitin-related modifier-like protein [Ordospora colligata]